VRIAFDLRRIKNPGIGRYMKCLVEAVVAQAPDHEYLLILPAGAEEMVRLPEGRGRKLPSTLKYYSFREQVELPRLLRRHEIELFHSPHFMLPLLRPCPCVITIHDVIYLACPEDLPSYLGRLYYRFMMNAAARRAVRIVTDSRFSKEDIVRFLNVDPSRIQVVYCGVDANFYPVTDPLRLEAVRARYGIERDYILYTGIYKPRKNHSVLLKAFQRFVAAGGNAQLVLAGPVNNKEEGKYEAGLKALASGLGIASQVVFAGFVPEADLPALYSAASLYACPSLYEGFGFTVLEAMACGTPVVCSRAASLPEVAGDAALYADAADPDAFAEALYRGFTDLQLRRNLVEKGRLNRQRFSWEEAARQTLAVYREAVYGPAGKAVAL